MEFLRNLHMHHEILNMAQKFETIENFKVKHKNIVFFFWRACDGDIARHWNRAWTFFLFAPQRQKKLFLVPKK